MIKEWMGESRQAMRSSAKRDENVQTEPRCVVRNQNAVAETENAFNRLGTNLT